MLDDCGCILIQTEARNRGGRQNRCGLALGQNQHRFSVRQDELQPCLGIVGIQWQVGSPGFKNAKQSHDHV
jgi:hypothetical protein